MAVANVNSVEEGALLSANAQNGVLGDDASGADGYATGGGVVGVRAAGADTTTAVTTGTGGNIAGLYGTLILNADGSYTYQSNPDSINANASDVFVYSIRDADGDQSTTTLTININNGTLTATTEDVLVDEAALSTGSNPASTAETITGTLADNVAGGAGGYSYTLVGSPTGNHGTLTSAVTGANADNGANVENNRETFTYIVTDANGNTTIGALTVDIKDDGPSITVNGNLVPSLTVDETQLAVNASASFADNFAQSFGADGAGSLSYALSATTAVSGLTDVANGQAIVLVNNGGVIEGRTATGNDLAFSVTVDAAGVVTLDQVRALTHPNAANADDAVSLAAGALVLTATATDRDGDTASAPLQIGGAFTFKDDGPSIRISTVSGAVEEEALAGGNQDTNDIANTGLVAAGSLTGLAAVGSDTPGTFSLNSDLSSLTAQGLTSAGVALAYSIVGDTLTAKAGALDVFTLQVTSAGAYTFILKDQLDHATGAAENTLVIQFGGLVKVTDGDGDSISLGGTTGANFNITVQDDMPIPCPGTIVASVDEDSLLGANIDAGRPGEVAGSGLATITGAAGALGGLMSAGADQPATFSIGSDLSSLTAQNLKSNGVALTYTVAGDTLTASAGVVEVFTLKITSAGGYTFTLRDQLDHPTLNGVAGDNTENTMDINFGGILKVTDLDGDSITLGGSTGADFAIRVQDDIPVAVDIPRTTSTNPALNLSGNLTDGTGAGFGADNGWVQVVSVDGATYIYNQKTDSTAGSTGVNGTFNTTSNQWTITTNNGGTLTVDMDDGAYTYAPPTSVAYLTVEDVGFTLTDNDGDTANANLRINVDGTALVVGQNVNDQPGQGTPHKVDGNPGTTGQISGASSSDLLVGDVGGGTLIGKQTNVVLILDTSGSMGSSAFGGGGAAGSGAGTGPTRLQALKDGVNDIIENLKASGATDVRVHINHFSDTVAPGAAGAQTFDLVINGMVQAAQVTAAHNFVNSFTATGFTNYEAGLQEALTWIGNGSADAVNNELVGPNVVNQAIFVSDGQPNRALTGNNTSLSSVVNYSDNATGWNSAMNQVLGAGGGDSVNEVTQIESKFGQIQAIGIGLDSAAIARLSQIEGVGGSAVNTTSATQFKNELASLSPSNELSAVGNDFISGGAGNDVIFGDTLNTDALGAAKGLGLPPGSGWDVFNTLENTPSANWTRADTLDYIRTHAEELAVESSGTGGIKRAGGTDTLEGGAGADTLYGQEGNDILIGGAGNDILSGGSGADTFKWGSGDQGAPGATTVDTVMDFNPSTVDAHKDVLDLRDLLQGEAHGTGDSGNLSSYLSFEQTGNDVTLSVKSSGAGAADQVIVLQNVTMQQLGGSSATDSAGVIQSLLNSGKLISD